MMADPGDSPDLQHRLASMLVPDVVGYVRLMQLDERDLWPPHKIQISRFFTRSSRSDARSF
jgi:hypothetical protein